MLLRGRSNLMNNQTIEQIEQASKQANHVQAQPAQLFLRIKMSHVKYIFM